MPSFTQMHDVERQPVVSLDTVSPVVKNMPNFRDRAGQGCFVCLESHRDGQYAVLVPCLRPTKARWVKGQSDVFSDNPKPIYEKMTPWDSACESDSDIYQRLTDTCYQHVGPWKKWLPYYGITEVLEVKFQFAGVVESDGHYPIQMESIEIEKVLEECESTIAKHPTDPVWEWNEQCDGDYHSEKCRIGMCHWNEPCIGVEAEKAEHRRKRLILLSRLKDCARHPARANGLRTLEGIASESCIYDTRGENKVTLPLSYESFRETVGVTGLHFVLGWQTDRLIELPFRVSCVWLGIAAIWLGLVLWGVGDGDWGIGLAFAQVVAASISILITLVQQ